MEYLKCDVNFELQPCVMKSLSLLLGLFLFINSSPNSVDLHEVIQLSDQIVLATITDVCDDSLTANVRKHLKGQSNERIEIDLNATEVNTNQGFNINDSFIFFLEETNQRELGLLFSLKQLTDVLLDQSYILIENDESYTIKLMPFIHAVESYIYNEQEISLAQLH